MRKSLIALIMILPLLAMCAGPQITSPTTGAKFVLVPAGTFTMGSSVPTINEKQHQVTISKPFYMQTTTVTQGQWQEVMGSNPSQFKDCGQDCPVENVSWNDAQDFIRKLNNQERTDKYRLPTEAEWEYAARAGTTTPFYTGYCLSTDQANYNGIFYPYPCPKGEYRGKTVRVASFAPNAWGLYDMYGNVWQWCQDWYGEYPSGSVTDPTGPSSGGSRVARGGSYNNRVALCRSAKRTYYTPDRRSFDVGFRLVRTY